MDLKIRGKIAAKFDLQSGTSKAGNAWQKQEYLIETLDAYPKKIKFDFFGDRVNQFPLEVGDLVDLSFDIESREFNGRWYTDIRGWNAIKVEENAAAPAQPIAAAPAPGPAPAPAAPFESAAQQPEDDLPF